MNIKRVLTTVIGLPIVVAVILVSNTYIIDAILTIVALIGMHEYIKCCSSKDAKIINNGIFALWNVPDNLEEIVITTASFPSSIVSLYNSEKINGVACEVVGKISEETNLV